VEYRTLTPPAPLDRWLRCVWWARDLEPSGDRAPERIVPDGCLELVLHLGDPFVRLETDGSTPRQRSAILAGQQLAPLRVRPTGRVFLFGLRFQPWAGAACLGASARDLTGRLVSADEGLGAAARELEDAVRAAPDDRERVRRALAWVWGRVRSRPTPPREVVGAVQELERAGGGPRVAELAEHLGVGTRRLERGFRDHVGLAPKSLARVLRLQAVLRRLRSGPAVPWSRVALDGGFADQAHLVREFQALAGLSPTAFAAEEHLLSDWFTQPA
jgi:AraC-like DNA-binding protein